MKKKGLIIATIVMVLVLAVSLTTATYAWFTAAARASVTKIGFSVTSDSDVLIGCAKTNAFKDGATNDDFVSGSGLDFNPNSQTDKWTGAGGLGFQINTGLQLTSLTQAVWSGSVANNVYSVDASDSFNAGSDVYVKSSGSGNTLTGDPALAIANGYAINNEEQRGDYLDVCFGVKANKDNLTGIALVIGIKVTGTSTTIGMNSAINYTYKIDDGDWSNLTDIYSYHYDTVKNSQSVSAPSVSFNGENNISIIDNNNTAIEWAKGDAVAVITIDTAASGTLDVNKIYQFHLRLFIAGYDSDCNNSAANTSADINLNFIATKQATQQQGG